MSLAIACAQLDGHDGSKAQRTDAAVAAIEDAAAGGAQLVVLPELWPVGFFHSGEYAAAAEPLHGPIFEAIAASVRRTSVWCYLGSFIERSDLGLHNTGLLLDPTGSPQFTYRKMHLFGYQSDEAKLLTPGGEPAVASTPFGIIGATTCFDLRFPELYRDLVDRGAEIILIASAWPAARTEHWRLLLRARAVENLVWVVACNATGTDAGVALAGHSAVIDPWGDVVAEAGTDQQILSADIDASRVHELRRQYPFLAERRYTVALGQPASLA